MQRILGVGHFREQLTRNIISNYYEMEMNKIAKYIVTGICLIGGMFIGVVGLFGVTPDDEPLTWAFLGEKALMIFVAWLLLETTKATCPEFWADADDEPRQDTADDDVNVLDGYDPFCLTEGDDYPAPDEFEMYVNVKY